jgi:hypothetical protein
MSLRVCAVVLIAVVSQASPAVPFAAEIALDPCRKSRL